MDKPLPHWLVRWLNQPNWKLLAMQWLALSCLILLFSLLLLQGKWQQLEQSTLEQRRLRQQIEPLWEQLARMPTLEAVNQSLQQIARQPATDDDLTGALQRAGVTPQRWQQQENSRRQTLRLHLSYGSLLMLLESLPARLRIDHMTVEAQAEGVTAHFTFQGSALADAAAVSPDE